MYTPRLLKFAFQLVPSTLPVATHSKSSEYAIWNTSIPNGPTCHTGSTSCFKEETAQGFIYELEQTIAQRIDDNAENSYTNKLYKSGINKVAQKVGEEAVELVIEALDNNTDCFKNEAADLLYHYLILLKAKGFKMEDIEEILKGRSEGIGENRAHWFWFFGADSSFIELQIEVFR